MFAQQAQRPAYNQEIFNLLGSRNPYIGGLSYDSVGDYLALRGPKKQYQRSYVRKTEAEKARNKELGKEKRMMKIQADFDYGLQTNPTVAAFDLGKAVQQNLEILLNEIRKALPQYLIGVAADGKVKWQEQGGKPTANIALLRKMVGKGSSAWYSPFWAMAASFNKLLTANKQTYNYGASGLNLDQKAALSASNSLKSALRTRKKYMDDNVYQEYVMKNSNALAKYDMARQKRLDYVTRLRGIM